MMFSKHTAELRINVVKFNKSDKMMHKYENDALQKFVYSYKYYKLLLTI